MKLPIVYSNVFCIFTESKAWCLDVTSKLNIMLTIDSRVYPELAKQLEAEIKETVTGNEFEQDDTFQNTYHWKKGDSFGDMVEGTDHVNNVFGTDYQIATYDETGKYAGHLTLLRILY